MNKNIRLAVLIIGLAAVSGFAESSNIELTPSGFGSIEFGQIVKGTSGGGAQINKTWVQKALMGFSLEAVIQGRWMLTLSPELKMWHTYPRQFQFAPSQVLHFDPYINHLEGSYFIEGEAKKPVFEICLGYFPFKYNAESRNLGEYLFRSGAHPPYLETEFDFPVERLFGLRTSAIFFKSLNMDLLLTNNVKRVPHYDFNLSLLADYDIVNKGFLTIGAGVSALSLIPNVDSLTTPKTSNNIKPGSDSNPEYISFRDTKIMGKFCFDPKIFFSRFKHFGPQDLKLYGEATVLGLKNNPRISYIDTVFDNTEKTKWHIEKVVIEDDILRRTPFMLGINLPAFGILDVISCEFEWFFSRYPGDIVRIIKENLPQARLSGYDPKAYKNDNFKWSVYLNKTFARHVTIIAQAANDHLRLQSYDVHNTEYEELMRESNDWYYVLKFKMAF